MNLQYISDSTGKTTGVFIPIVEWNWLKQKFKDIDHEEIDVPAWYKSIVRERLASYKSQPDQAMDFNSAMDDIEKDLKCISYLQVK